MLRRSLLSELTTTELCLCEKGSDVQVLVAGMYDAALPLTWDNLGPLMELARKYDVRDIEHNCTTSLRATPLNATVLPRALRLAATHGLEDVVAKCQEAIAAEDMFEQLKRYA
jgi:BTB/POZ domain